MTKAALIGKAGEAIVAAELMRQGISIAYPAYDGGIDLLAFREENFGRVVPIQVKARSSSCYNFQKSWFRVPGIVLVQVWNSADNPECFVFASVDQVVEALGEHANSPSWQDRGGYNVTTPTVQHRARMEPHRAKWDRIVNQLP